MKQRMYISKNGIGCSVFESMRDAPHSTDVMIIELKTVTIKVLLKNTKKSLALFIRIFEFLVMPNLLTQ